MLSSDQIQQYHEEGFLVIDNVFSDDEIEDLRAVLNSREWVDALNERGLQEHTVHMLNITTMHPAFLALAREPKVTERIASLIGPDIQLNHSKLAIKPPVAGKGLFHWHQDFAYFPHTNTDVLAVMIMLDDATPENGCMSVVRGSHTLGLLNHTKDGYFAGACLEDHHWAEESNLARVTPRAGGISIHHALTLHGSPANISGHPRRGIVFQYRAADAYQLADNLWDDGGLLIRGKRTDKVRCEAATFQLPRFKHRDPQFGSIWRQESDWAKEMNGRED
ncbi:MAG: phytanoyl-CoA dioxygenase family protein [Planctomycetota bacterium]|nr:phytanoyl-CoA dioxygenase family protein [Planctomycetota bacterium]